MENVWIKRMVKAFWNLEKVKQEAGTLGIFTYERELLKCPSCGLLEDVREERVLVAYHRDSEGMKVLVCASVRLMKTALFARHVGQLCGQRLSGRRR